MLTQNPTNFSLCQVLGFWSVDDAGEWDCYRVRMQQYEFILIDKEIFLYCPNGYGNTKLTNNFFENKLKVSATTRNWKTVNKLLEMAEMV